MHKYQNIWIRTKNKKALVLKKPEEQFYWTSGSALFIKQFFAQT